MLKRVNIISLILSIIYVAEIFWPLFAPRPSGPSLFYIIENNLSLLGLQYIVPLLFLITTAINYRKKVWPRIYLINLALQALVLFSLIQSAFQY